MKAIEASLWTIFVVFIIGLATIAIIREFSTRQAKTEAPVPARELERGESMEYINFDGHEYVRYRSGMGNCSVGGIAHSPKCPCGNISKHHL